MIDIAVNELNKYYGAHHVLKGISFEIYSGEKVGLLGKNGSGKTTLFKVITGEELYESGSVTKSSGKKVEMLAQIPVFGENDTAEDILRSSFKEVTEIYTMMKAIEGDENPSVLARYGRLMEQSKFLRAPELFPGSSVRNFSFRMIETRGKSALFTINDCFECLSPRRIAV